MRDRWIVYSHSPYKISHGDRHALSWVKTYDTTRMRADHDTSFGRHEEDRQDFLNTPSSARIDLTNVDSFELEQLLECHLVWSVTFQFASREWIKTDSVVGVLSGSDTDTVWLECFSDSGVTESVIRCCWLLGIVSLTV